MDVSVRNIVSYLCCLTKEFQSFMNLSATISFSSMEPLSIYSFLEKLMSLARIIVYHFCCLFSKSINNSWNIYTWLSSRCAASSFLSTSFSLSRSDITCSSDNGFVTTKTCSFWLVTIKNSRGYTNRSRNTNLNEKNQTREVRELGPSIL